jgi:hypothetical protein
MIVEYRNSGRSIAMNTEAHVETLRAKHASLEEAILEERQRPSPDTIRISDLKKQKLRIKDEIARLSESN